MWLNHPSFTPTDSLFFSYFKLDVIFSDKAAVRFSSLVANKEDGRWLWPVLNLVFVIFQPCVTLFANKYKYKVLAKTLFLFLALLILLCILL